jgi:HSP20 family protein
MAIAVRGSAWSPFATLVRQFDTDFDTLVRHSFGPARRSGDFVPAADVTREGQDLVVTLALPGVDVDKDVEVVVSEGRLVITGRRAERQESERGGVVLREIHSGQFRREFSLPKGVTAENVEADYDKGLLRVRVREVVRPTPERTKVKVRTLTAGSAPTDTPAVEGGSTTEAN